MPYICIPAQTNGLLTDHERAAVVAHELAHVKRFDLIQSLCVQALGDVFWFIPFYDYLKGQVERLREIVADNHATNDPEQKLALSSALLKLQSMKTPPPQATLYSALAKHPSLIKERITLLLYSEATIPLSWKRRLLYACSGVLITGTVFTATFGNNYRIEHPSEHSQKLSNHYED